MLVTPVLRGFVRQVSVFCQHNGWRLESNDGSRTRPVSTCRDSIRMLPSDYKSRHLSAFKRTTLSYERVLGRHHRSTSASKSSAASPLIFFLTRKKRNAHLSLHIDSRPLHLGAVRYLHDSIHSRLPLKKKKASTENSAR